MASWKLGASTTFEILQRSTGTLCKQKSYISKGIQSIFEIFASARRCWRWSFGWKVSGAQVFCFCNGKVKTWRIDNIWNFATFNLYTVPAKILYLQRYSGDFRNLRLISRMWTVAIWLKSFRCARILLLQWQGERLCIDNIWNFATFNLYTVQAEILYLQRYSTNFRNLRVSSTMLRVGIFVVSFRWAAVLLLQWQTENFAHRQHLKFCHYQPVHCASKNPISPKVFNRFSKSLPSSKMLTVAIWVWSFTCAGVLLLQWQSENFAHRQHFKFCHFQPVHCASRNPISPKIFNQFSKSSRQLEDVEGGHLGGKFQVRRYFTFAMARWELGASTTFEILARSTCTLCQQKSYISKGIQSIFEIFASARRCWRWPFGWKVSGAHVFCFCNGKVKTWRIDNIWNFPTFNLYTVPAKILYLERYSGDFRNLRLISKMWTVAIWLKSFRCARILLLQWQGERLCIDNIWNFATFNLYTVQAKILYLQRYSINFRNLCLSSKMLTMVIWVESFRCAGILLLQWQSENLAHRQYLKFCHFQPVHCASKNPISPKVFRRFSKSSPHLEDVDGGHLVEKFHVRTYFTSAMARWTFVHRQHLKFCYFQPVHFASRNPISPKIFNQFSKSSRQLDDVEGGHLCGKFHVSSCFTFAMANWKLCASTTFEILPLSTCTLCQQKSYISKGIQPIFEIFAPARRCWWCPFGWEVSGAQVF